MTPFWHGRLQRTLGFEEKKGMLKKGDVEISSRAGAGELQALLAWQRNRLRTANATPRRTCSVSFW